ncbi:MAG TPA: stalk domain-containing protein, partial [Caldisericia bacterium]|nr:stalk domain-containing protein [Caldisericia bacterium]
DNEGAVKEIIVKEQNVEKESFLIITSKKISDSKILDNFISYKKAKGFMVNIKNVEDIEKNYSGIDLPEKIRNYLKQDYLNNKIKYLLLIGNPYNSKYQTTKSTGGSIPMRYCYPDPKNHTRSNDTNKDGSVPTDYYYADLTGDWDSDEDGYYGEYQQDNVDFENELIVGRIPFDDINTIKEILDRSIEFEEKNLIKDNKKILMAGDILKYGENDCKRTDAAQLFENIWNDFLNNRNFERVTLYEKDGIEPSVFKPDLSLNRDNLINELSTNNFDIVSIFTNSGYIDLISRRIWNKDDGDKIPENDEFLCLDLINKEDEDLIFPKFSKSIYLIQSFWPSCIDYPDFDSISELLFKRCAVALIGNVRHYCLICGWNSLEDGTSLSIFYKILDNLSNSKTIGESLYNSLNYYSKNFIYEWWYCKWYNLFSFATLFGDPTISLYPKIIPQLKVEKISLELTSDNYVLINWSTSIQGTFKVKGYYLYRGEDSENFSLIATLNSETNRYLDKDVKSGKIYYYYIKAFDELGNESDPSDIVTITIPIKDISPPILEIYSPKDMEMVNKNSISIRGKTYDDISGIKKLLINDYEVNVSQTGEFSFNVSLLEGINQIKIISIDNSDNKTEKILTIPVDTKPPILNLSIPNEVNNKDLTIKGTVYDEGLSGIKNNSITINGKTLIVSNGNINYIIELSEGLNNIVIVAEDNVGNKTSKTYIVKYIKKITIILQIGNYNCFVNNNKIEMDTSPKIIQGRTYLPIRYIITPLGGEISWDSIEKKITILFKEKIIDLWIGKNYARINGEIKLIDPDNPNVVPIIIEGRTMLPIRFVAENLGCRVDWDGATKTITIIYPAD